MAIEVRIRVVAEIYRGIDFPDDWVTHSTDITGVMGRELIISVIALLDAERQPVAVCWKTADRDEQFTRSRFDDTADASVLESVERDMATLARSLGFSGSLLPTMLWEPQMVPRSQAKPIEKLCLPAADIPQPWSGTPHLARFTPTPLICY